MRKRFVWFLLFSTFGLTAQNNLILNPSCEDASQIPDNLGGYPYCINWWNPFIYTTDYFTSLTSASNYNFIPNSSFGYQKCIEGNYFLGIVLLDWYNSITDYYHFRADYAGGNFSDPLIKNNIYQFEFWMSKADKGLLQTNAIDLIITYDTIVDVNDYSNFGYKIWSEQSPMTDTINWIKVSTCFKAKGGEKAFAIGNFHNKEEVIKYLQLNPNEDGYVDYRYLDKFSLIECPTCCPEQFPNQEQVNVFSNPATSFNPATIEIWLNPNTTGKLEIYDSAGRLVAEEYYSDLQNVYTFAQFASGIYHYCVSTETGFTEYGKVLVVE
jgi:hypothetical protein